MHKTITFDTAVPLQKSHFKDLEEFQIALHLVPEPEFTLTAEQEKDLQERIKEADQNPEDGIPFEEVLKSLEKKYA